MLPAPPVQPRCEKAIPDTGRLWIVITMVLAASNATALAARSVICSTGTTTSARGRVIGEWIGVVIVLGLLALAAPAGAEPNLESDCSNGEWRVSMAPDGDAMCGTSWRPHGFVPTGVTPPGGASSYCEQMIATRHSGDRATMSSYGFRVCAQFDRGYDWFTVAW